MSSEFHSTRPKPFVLVLMPFKPEFDDIYRFGIKGAAEDAGAYAERVDEQYFLEGILDRIYNQINKADVIVADMSGQNPNVFYEVGYAHALGKIVLLLTKSSDDIPFDLRHRPHIVYEGSIEKLRKSLTDRLRWAISESEKQRKGEGVGSPDISINEIAIPASSDINASPIIEGKLRRTELSLSLIVRNSANTYTPDINFIYIFVAGGSNLVPGEYITGGSRARPLRSTVALPQDSFDGLNRQVKLKSEIPGLPPSAYSQTTVVLTIENFKQGVPTEPIPYRLRIHAGDRYYDYPFRLQLPPKEASNVTTPVPNSS